MEELNVNTTEPGYDFCLSTVMDEKNHKEFNSLLYRQRGPLWCAFVILSAVNTVLFGFVFPLDFYNLILSLFIFLFMLTMYIYLEYCIKTNYKRMLFTSGKTVPVHTHKFGEKIFSFSNGTSSSQEFDYEDIVSLKETKNLYLIGLKHNLYLLLQKSTMSDTESTDFIQYIFDKCKNIKKKRVKKLNNKKPLCFVCMCLSGVLFLISLAVYFFFHNCTIF